MSQIPQPRPEPIPPRFSIRLSPLFISKIVILSTFLLIAIWLSLNLLQIGIHKIKLQAKLSGNSKVELSALDQQSFRSFYFYNLIKQQAKQRVKAHQPSNNNKISKDFEEISFKELYGIFKVIKAQELALGSQEGEAENEILKVQEVSEEERGSLEKNYNYTDWFGPAVNQYRCASCYSFPITATIQYLYRKAKNQTLKLSEQQLIDCSGDSTAEPYKGCSDGNMTKGFDYAVRVGLVQAHHYPYRSQNGSSYDCRKQIVENSSIPKYKIKEYVKLTEGDCRALQKELARGRVIAAMINAEQLFQYEKGIFRNCKKDAFNHAITIVGQSSQQWIIRNSWGSSWGENGYFLIGQGNTCGICTNAIVPLLDQATSQ